MGSSCYTPMRGPLPGQQFKPYGAIEGELFIEHWCTQCARDRAMREGEHVEECDDDELCQVLAASYRGEAVEWRELDDGNHVCLAFIPAGQPVPGEPDEHTLDLFEAGLTTFEVNREAKSAQPGALHL
jgi:hypothetical protein